jgi:acyl-CoA thioesterase-2
LNFFYLNPTHNTHRWFLSVTRGIVSGPPDRLFLFGGVGLGAAIEAMERTLGQPVLWATAQYASFAPLGSIVDLDVREVNAGRNITQARVVAHIHDREILAVNAALGQKEGPSDQWLRAPSAPPPEECPEVSHWRSIADRVNERLEMRLIDGRYPTGAPISGRSEDGQLRLWVRPRDAIPVTASLLAVVADFLVEATSHALGRYAGGNSLDNTIRFGRIVQSDWLLCDMKIEMTNAGITHGTMKIFGQDGVLMASGSQSLILRLHAPESVTQPESADSGG